MVRIHAYMLERLVHDFPHVMGGCCLFHAPGTYDILKVHPRLSHPHQVVDTVIDQTSSFVDICTGRSMDRQPSSPDHDGRGPLPASTAGEFAISDAERSIVRGAVERLFSAIDPHHNGFVSKHVFLRAVQLEEKVRSILLHFPSLLVLGQPRLYLQAFKEMDTDHNNKLSVDEVAVFVLATRHHAQQLKESVAAEDPKPLADLDQSLDEIFDLVDVNHDGKISKQEMIRALTQDYSVRSTLLSYEALWPLGKPRLFEETFDKMSTIMAGFITREEFVAFAQNVAQDPVLQEELTGKCATDEISIASDDFGEESEEEEEEAEVIQHFIQNLTIATSEEAQETKASVLNEKARLEKRMAQKLKDLPDILGNAIDRHAITELRAYSTPPEYVTFAMEPLCILFGKRPTWKGAWSLLCRPTLVRDMKELNVLGLSDKTMERVSRYTMHPDFDPAVLRMVSLAAAKICHWVHAIYDFYNVSIALRPVQTQLDAVNQKLSIVSKFLAAQEGKGDALHFNDKKEKEFEQFSMHFVSQYDQTFRAAHEKTCMANVLREANSTVLSAMLSEETSTPSKKPFPLHPIDWQGSPSSFKGFTFSASANATLINTQDIPREPPSLPPEYEPTLVTRARTAGRRRHPQGASRRVLPSLNVTPVQRPNTAPTGEALMSRPEWVGSPSTFRELSFSSTSNRTIVNVQSIPVETPAVPGYSRRPQTAEVHGLDASTSLRSLASRASSRRRNTVSEIKPMTRDQARLSKVLGLVIRPCVHDQEWVGSPSSELPFTFSRTANKHFKNLQLWPQYDATKDKNISFTNTRSFKKFYKGQVKRADVERSSIIKVRQQAMRLKNKSTSSSKFRSLAGMEPFSLESLLGPDGAKTLSSVIQKTYNAWKSNRERFNTITGHCRGFDINKTGVLPLSDFHAAAQNSGLNLSDEEVHLMQKVAEAFSIAHSPTGKRKKTKKKKKNKKVVDDGFIEYDGILQILFSWKGAENSGSQTWSQIKSNNAHMSPQPSPSARVAL